MRRALSADLPALARAAATRYPEELRVGTTGVLTRPGWLLPTPIDLDAITLAHDPMPRSATFDGTEEVTRALRPLCAPGRRYQRYSHAIRDIARPKLLENRPSWRLLEAEFSTSDGQLLFGDMTYFDAIDVCEAIAHETAAAHRTDDGPPFRRAIGDPFDLSRRALLLSVNTLTVWLDSTGASIVLHHRSAQNVATSGGVIGVMPAGVFQPSVVREVDHQADFDLWRNIMREYSEEFLGNPEHIGDGQAADYTAEPFRTLDAARRAGRIRVWCFGIGVGALDLWGAVETVAVFDADVFDEVFANLVRFNDEGSVLRVGAARPSALIPFTEGTIEELRATGRLAPETALSLDATWQHRDQLLGRRQR